jgi:hypothetical protein
MPIAQGKVTAKLEFKLPQIADYVHELLVKTVFPCGAGDKK